MHMAIQGRIRGRPIYEGTAERKSEDCKAILTVSPALSGRVGGFGTPMEWTKSIASRNLGKVGVTCIVLEAGRQSPKLVTLGSTPYSVLRTCTCLVAPTLLLFYSISTTCCQSSQRPNINNNGSGFGSQPRETFPPVGYGAAETIWPRVKWGPEARLPTITAPVWSKCEPSDCAEIDLLQ